MKEIHFFDKSIFAEGPWQEEPDYVAWVDETTMYPCVARRNIFGAWGGYVGVDSSHPLYAVNTLAEVYDFIEVHRGIHYTSFSMDESRNFEPPIRHWWIGFDCMEPNDLLPHSVHQIRPPRKRKNRAYRDLPYVKDQVTKLAHQLANMDERMSEIMTKVDNERS